MPDPFTLLGVEPRYDLDLLALKEQHRELSRALHPDRYAGRAAAERRAALGRAIEVNQAWRALSDPVFRAEALLERLGVATGETAEPQADPGFLAEMLDRRESLSEARRERSLEAVRSLAADMRQKESALVGDLGEHFARLAVDPDRSSATLLRKKLGELRFCRRFLDEASSIEDDLL